MSGQPNIATAASCENSDLASSSREVQLSVRGLSKAFHGRQAIEDIDFTASRHEFVAVLGPSGAGKTTLFRCITGLLAADQGTVRIGMSEVTSVMTRRLRMFLPGAWATCRPGVDGCDASIALIACWHLSASIA